ncbi:hypothetical protein EAG_12738 [Camponotus floridanus]|uniref:Uncharacterized protein n=1 Tax=Camponotus floridanus TaxID=104421 RepID=E2AZE0_CAMFO|nr:hypothetical protein EAG_12738 [Camponotus floridanus]
MSDGEETGEVEVADGAGERARPRPGEIMIMPADVSGPNRLIVNDAEFDGVNLPALNSYIDYPSYGPRGPVTWTKLGPRGVELPHFPRYTPLRKLLRSRSKLPDLRDISSNAIVSQCQMSEKVQLMTSINAIRLLVELSIPSTRLITPRIFALERPENTVGRFSINSDITYQKLTNLMTELTVESTAKLLMEPLPGGYFVTAEAPMEGLGRRAAVKGDGRVSSGDSRLLTSLQLTEVSLSMIKGSAKFANNHEISLREEFVSEQSLVFGQPAGVGDKSPTITPMAANDIILVFLIRPLNPTSRNGYATPLGESVRESDAVSTHVDSRIRTCDKTPTGLTSTTKPFVGSAEGATEEASEGNVKLNRELFRTKHLLATPSTSV